MDPVINRSTLERTLRRSQTLPIWLQEPVTLPPPPPPSESGIFWPRAVKFLMVSAIAAPLSYYFAVVTSPLHKHPIEVAAAPPPADRVVSGPPVQRPPATRDRLRASVAGPRSASLQQGMLKPEPVLEPPESPRSPPATTGVAEGRARSPAPPPERASVSAMKTANLQDAKLLIDRGEQFFETGDLISARILFTRAANAGDAAAAVAMGATFDPIALAERGVRGVPADLAKARSWYERAKVMGSPEGSLRLEMLANR